MSFLHPEILYYLLPLALILFGFLLTQKEAQATFFSQEVMEKLKVTQNNLTQRARNALFMIISVLIIIALAGPVIKEGKVEVKAKSADVMIALDISDSMLAEDVYPNRLESAKQKAMELLKLAPNERMGVIAFAKNSYLVSPLSFDHNAVGFLLRQLDTTSITEKGTNLLSMLNVVDSSVKKESKKYLLILSDGGDGSDFSKEIAYAKEKNIVVFILGIGTVKGSPIKAKDGKFIKQNGEIIVSRLNENIVNLATKTAGVYIENVRSDEDVKAMLGEIEKHSEKRELKSEEIERFTPLFYYPLGLALFLLLVATSSLGKFRAKAPIALYVFMALAFNLPQTHAGVLDFMELDAAKEAYEAKDYNKSSQTYERYAKKTNNSDGYYNAGNSLYKQKKYDEAIKSYEKATFDDASKEAKKYANIGNALVKQMKPESLEQAVKSYEKSLELADDGNTRENLEAVKKALEEQKKKNEDKKESKDDKEKKESDKDKKDKDKKGSKESKKSDKESSKSDEKSDKKEQSDDKKSKDENKKKENDSKESQDANKTKEQEQKRDKLKELDKNDDDKSQEKNKENAFQGAVDEFKMSDAEEAKWLKKLNQQKNTYMYMLNNEDKHEEDSNEKPW